jgi:predicted O-methyltransferase YrrM
VLPIVDLNQLFPGISEITVNLPMWQFRRRNGMLGLAELVALSAICRFLSPKRIFEIGTFTGSSIAALALHSPEEAIVFTLDLPSADFRTAFPLEIGNIAGKAYSIGSLYRKHCGQKIRQLVGDSAVFDFSPYYGTVDMVFVDGNHKYANVASDTNQALRMVAPRGAVVWDNYDAKWGPGVMRALEERSELPIVQIAGTGLAVYYRNGGQKQS